MKRKTLTIAISIFALIAIVSVGFASWVISRPLQTKDGKGNITVETVNETSTNTILSVVLDGDGYEETSNGEIHFGKPSDEYLNSNPISGDDFLAEDDRWFSFDSSTKVQSLSVSGTINLASELVNTVDKLHISVAGDERFTAAKGANYVEDFVISISSDDGSIDENGYITSSKSEIHFTLTINWGSAFGNENPYYYYNKVANTYESKKNDAKTALEGINNLNNAIFTVTVKISANNTSSQASE